MRLIAVIPCRDEAGSVAAVVGGVLALAELGHPARVIVVDNGSTDATTAVAVAAGAMVVAQPHSGYGWACHAGVSAALAATPAADVVAFLDGDGSMPPAALSQLVAPIAAGSADLVCGRRLIPASAMPWHQRAGNELIGLELRALYRLPLHELGPFRAIRASTLATLAMPPSRYAWAAEMLARAAAAGARVTEVEVAYAERTAGRSKVGGSLRSSLLAAWDICGTLALRRVGR
ncbi:MAG: glycosyltransferase family 2 protein [Candidatus Dormibacteria bacterium]